MNRGHSDGVVVDILERKYTFATSSEKTVEHITKVAALVDERLRRAQSAHGSQTTLQTAVIASLELVDELFRMREQYEAAETDIATRASRLTSDLGRLLQEVGPARDSSATDSEKEGFNRQNSLRTLAAEAEEEEDQG